MLSVDEPVFRCMKASGANSKSCTPADSRMMVGVRISALRSFVCSTTSHDPTVGGALGAEIGGVDIAVHQRRSLWTSSEGRFSNTMSWCSATSL